MFPYGETFIINKARETLPLIKDGSLVNEIDILIKQEIAHSHMHNLLNKALINQGFNLSICKKIRLGFLNLCEKLSLRHQFIIIISLEHLAYHFGLCALENQKGDNEVSSFWCWHAAEEIGHRATAIKIFQALFDEHPKRWELICGLLVSLIGDTLVIIAGIGYCLKHKKLNPKDLFKDIPKTLFGSKGFLKYIGLAFKKYCKKNYHPADDVIPESIFL
jgi:predicted metal-dependent hydrolase